MNDTEIILFYRKHGKHRRTSSENYLCWSKFHNNCPFHKNVSVVTPNVLTN